MIPIDILPGAHRDFDESFDWYVERSVQAAELFTNAVDAALTRIAQHPEQFASIDRLHRACPVLRFPFRIESHRALVVAIAHAKRRPGYWKERT
jgi:plasmid stabilization system protein ParE